MSKDLLRDGVVLDLSMVTRQALQFMIRPTSPPSNGHPQSTTDPFGAVTNFYPWGIESSEAMVNNRNGRVEGYLVQYVFPSEDDEYLYGYSLGAFLDPVTKLMSDSHWGPQVRPLIKQHLPFTFAMLQAGIGMATGFGIVRVRTDTAHWFVGSFLMSRTPGQVDLDVASLEHIREAACLVLSDALGWPTNVPGLIEIMGGPDRLHKYIEVAQEVIEVMGYIKDALEMIRSISR